MTIWSKAAVFAFMACMGGSALVGCTVSDSDASRFREPVPNGDDVALRVPNRGEATGSTSQGLRLQSPTGAAVSDAKFYTFTRDLTRDIDRTTAGILGAVWALASLPPTTVEDKRAVWGPGASSSLEPNEWRLVVTEVASSEYEYAFEGRPRSGGAFRAVLTGKGYAKSHAAHDTGFFQVDHEAYRALEPSNVGEDDQGTTKVTFDLPKSTIAVAMRRDAKGTIDVSLVREAGGAGHVDITALTDVDGTGPALEDVKIASRWNTSGAGRADVAMAKGDLPTTINATECWSSAFTRVFYEDNVASEPKVGEASACALPAP